MKKRLLTAVLTGLFLLSASICMGGSAHLAKTGQTISYQTGDDGDYEKGVVSPSPRFTDNGDGTVCDSLTGLMWAKDANLDNGTMTWNDAIDYANNLSLGNGGCGSCGTSYTDWRLPNVKELHSLIDFGQSVLSQPALPSGHPFTNVQTDFYWSSTSYVTLVDNAWVINMGNGGVITNYKSPKVDGLYMWPVRDAN